MSELLEISGSITGFSECSSDRLVLENPPGVFKKLFVVPVNSSRIATEYEDQDGLLSETRIRNCGTPLYEQCWIGIPVRTGDDTPKSATPTRCSGLAKIRRR